MTHQGFLGSFSTGALLVGAAVAILVVLGALLAFNGFPGPSSDSSTETFMLEGEPAIADAAGDGGASFELIDPEPGSAAAAAAGTPPAAPAPAPAPDLSTGTFLSGPSGDVGPAGPVTNVPGPDRDGDGGPNGDGPIDRLLGDGTQLGDPVRNLTDTVDGTLDRLSPSTKPLGDLLQDTTEPLSRTLDSTGASLGL